METAKIFLLYSRHCFVLKCEEERAKMFKSRSWMKMADVFLGLEGKYVVLKKSSEPPAARL